MFSASIVAKYLSYCAAFYSSYIQCKYEQLNFSFTGQRTVKLSFFSETCIVAKDTIILIVLSNCEHRIHHCWYFSSYPLRSWVVRERQVDNHCCRCLSMFRWNVVPPLSLRPTRQPRRAMSTSTRHDFHDNGFLCLCKKGVADSEGLWRWFVVKMANLLVIIHRLFLIKTLNVSETGVCFCHWVKDMHSIGPNRIGVFNLMTETESSLRNFVCFNQKQSIDNTQQVCHLKVWQCQRAEWWTGYIRCR
jgi:hypothetical protein